MKYLPLKNLKSLKIKYSRAFGEQICPFISQTFPSLTSLHLISCPIGTSDCTRLGHQFLPALQELDLSGDSYLSKQSLTHISICMPQLRTFHLGHFEHSDYACSDTVRKKQGQLPLRGLFVCQILKDPQRFEQLSTLYLERSCDLTDFIVHEIRREKIRNSSLQIKFDNT